MKTRIIRVINNNIFPLLISLKEITRNSILHNDVVINIKGEISSARKVKCESIPLFRTRW